MSHAILNFLILVRQLHAGAFLLFPFEVMKWTAEGLDNCSISNVTSDTCLLYVSLFTQRAVMEIAWSTLFQGWRKNLVIKATLFALVNVLIATVDTWSGHGADMDTASSMEIQFSQKMAIFSVIVSLAVYREAEPRERLQRDEVQESNILAEVSDILFLVICFTRLLASTTAMWDPIDSLPFRKVPAWKMSENMVLGRILALLGAHTTGLLLSLMFTPGRERGGFSSYLLLLTPEAFAYLVHSGIAPQMPKELLLPQLMAAHAFFMLLYCVGLFILFLAARRDSIVPGLKGPKAD